MTAAPDRPCRNCGHAPEEHDPAPPDDPSALGGCAVCDCEEFK